MAHLLVITGGLMGVVNPSCAVAGRLVARGHRVTYASPADIGDVIAARGLTFLPLPPSDDRWSDHGSPLSRLLRIRSRRAAALAALGVEDLAARVDAVAPDAVLVEIERHAHMMSLVAAGHRVGLLSPFLSIFDVPGIPPLHLTDTPTPGPAGDAELRATWTAFRAWKRQRLERRRRRGLGVGHETTLRRHASRVGYDPGRLDPDQWLMPFVDRELPVLTMHDRAFDFPHKPPPRAHHLGPMVDVDRPEAPLPAEDERRLAAVLERSRAPERRLVLVSISTAVPGSAELLGRVVEAVRDRPDRDVVLGLGGRLDAAALGPLPDHVHAFGYVPQMRVLPLTGAAIITAGPSSMAECALFGVPVVVWSLDRNDQNGNAARVGYHGLGVVGGIDDAPETIGRDLDTALTDPDIRAAVDRMQAHLAVAVRSADAARAIESALDLPAPEGATP